jgi:DNA polymerase alpha-associated DNA helicase A
MSLQPISIQSFTTHQISLLTAELAAETASTASILTSASPTALARAGFAILNLIVSAQRTGLGGKTVLELEHDPAIGNGKNGAGDHGIRVGDIVRVGEQPKGNERKREKAEMEGKGVEGVVVRVGQRGLQVALDEEGVGDDLKGRLWV